MSKNNHEKAIKDAQYRKSLSISYFNSLNAAIELCKGLNPHEERTFEKITEIRDRFLEEHAKYHAEVIQKVGVNYDAKESIKKLEATKNLEELNDVWISFSQDERQDEQIRKIASKLNKKYGEEK